jgi:hypothetical protein
MADLLAIINIVDWWAAAAGCLKRIIQDCDTVDG